MNKAIQAFGEEVVLQWVRQVELATPDLRWISVGSGNGALEAKIGNVICVDPDPLSYNSDGLSSGLKEPYCAPSYAYLDQLLAADPSVIGACRLLLNWCPPNDSDFDYQAIQALKPVAVLSIYERFAGGNGAAGGRKFHEWYDENPCFEACLEDSPLDFRIGWWQEGADHGDLQQEYPALKQFHDPCVVQ